MSKLFEVQEYHRGEWIPVMVTDKKGKKRPKTVRITQQSAEEMSRSTLADVEERRRSNGFRYIAIADPEPVKDPQSGEMETPEGVPSFGQMKKELKEAGIVVSPKAKKTEVEALYNEHILNK